MEVNYEALESLSMADLIALLKYNEEFYDEYISRNDPDMAIIYSAENYEINREIKKRKNNIFTH